MPNLELSYNSSQQVRTFSLEFYCDGTVSRASARARSRSPRLPPSDGRGAEPAVPGPGVRPGALSGALAAVPGPGVPLSGAGAQGSFAQPMARPVSRTWAAGALHPPIAHGHDAVGDAVASALRGLDQATSAAAGIRAFTEATTSAVARDDKNEQTSSKRRRISRKCSGEKFLGVDEPCAGDLAAVEAFICTSSDEEEMKWLAAAISVLPQLPQPQAS